MTQNRIKEGREHRAESKEERAEGRAKWSDDHLPIVMLLVYTMVLIKIFTGIFLTS